MAKASTLKKKGTAGGLLALIVALIAAWLGGGLEALKADSAAATAPESVPAANTDRGGTPAHASGIETVLEAYENKTSEIMVEVAGTVERTLADDNEGSRHQRFILRLTPDFTVLVVHNIDLAPRVPLERGDQVTLMGQYEWNDKGGLFHWTHHDPGGYHEEGWIEVGGKRYE